MHDLVIDNAVVIDGLGGPARSGGTAIDGGRITVVGTDLGPARQRVDAGGLVLAPGIVDIHTHDDAQLTWDPFATPSTALGVTTVVIGNCGFTISPCRPSDRDLTLRNLTHVEGMSLETLPPAFAGSSRAIPSSSTHRPSVSTVSGSMACERSTSAASSPTAAGPGACSVASPPDQCSARISANTSFAVSSASRMSGTPT